MSESKRKDREPLDDYPTKLPYAMEMTRRVRALWARIHGGIEPSVIVEPSAGAGTFVRACRAHFPSSLLLANELQGKYAPALGEAGAALISIEDTRIAVPGIGEWRARSGLTGPVLFIGNPPFAPAQSHIESILDIMQPGDVLAFLLRINYLGGQDRVRTLFERRTDHKLTYVIPFAQRPSFKPNKDGKKGSDMTEYGCFIWVGGYTSEEWTGLPHLWVRDEERLAA